MFPRYSAFRLTLPGSYSMVAHMSGSSVIGKSSQRRRIIGPALKAIREAKAAYDPAFRGSEFAIRCLMTPGHLCNIEHGRKQPPEDVVHRIAAHLGVPVEAISYTVPEEAAS